MQDDKNILCIVPRAIQFEYYPEQQMHSTLEIINLMDVVVKYKIQTNQSSLFLYLVKPMEGQIYNKQTTKIKFTRKQLSLDQFKHYLKSSQSQSKQKFKIYLQICSKDFIGRKRVTQQVQSISVHFCTPKVKSISNIIKNKNQTQEYEYEQQLNRLKKQLNQLEIKLKQMNRDLKSNNNKQFKQFQLILLMIWAFLFGLIIQ